MTQPRSDGRRAASAVDSGDVLNGLVDLMTLTTYDARLRQVPTNRPAIEHDVARAQGRLVDARANGNVRDVARLLGYVGEGSRVLGRLDEAIGYHEEALGLARAFDDRRIEVASRIRLAEAHRYRGNLGTAEDLFREALDQCSAPDLAEYEDFALQHLGKCLIDRGDAMQVITYLERALARRRGKGMAALIASTDAALVLARASARCAHDVRAR